MTFTAKDFEIPADLSIPPFLKRQPKETKK